LDNTFDAICCDVCREIEPSSSISETERGNMQMTSRMNRLPLIDAFYVLRPASLRKILGNSRVRIDILVDMQIWTERFM